VRERARKVKKLKKMRSSRGKAPLRMTGLYSRRLLYPVAVYRIVNWLLD